MYDFLFDIYILFHPSFEFFKIFVWRSLQTCQFVTSWNQSITFGSSILGRGAHGCML